MKHSTIPSKKQAINIMCLVILVLSTCLSMYYLHHHPELESNATINNQANHYPLITLLNVSLFTFPICLCIYYLATLVYIKSNRDALVQGLYDNSSWLNLNDNCLIWVYKQQVTYVSFSYKEADKIQRAYQHCAIDEMIGFMKKPTIKTLSLSDITEVTSKQDSHRLTLKTEQSSIHLPFLNPVTKQHALLQMQPSFPTHLAHQVERKSRLSAILPWLLFTCLCGMIAIYFSMPVISLCAAIIAVLKVIPMLITRLVFPTIIQSWQRPELQL